MIFLEKIGKPFIILIIFFLDKNNEDSMSKRYYKKCNRFYLIFKSKATIEIFICLTQYTACF